MRRQTDARVRRYLAVGEKGEGINDNGTHNGDGKTRVVHTPETPGARRGEPVGVPSWHKQLAAAGLSRARACAPCPVPACFAPNTVRPERLQTSGLGSRRRLTGTLDNGLLQYIARARITARPIPKA